MAKPIFALRQRVNVPEHDNVQGVITRVTESVADPANYYVRWLSTSGRGQEGWFSEAEMLVTNMVLAAPAIAAAAVKAVARGPVRRRATSWRKVRETFTATTDAAMPLPVTVTSVAPTKPAKARRTKRGTKRGAKIKSKR